MVFDLIRGIANPYELKAKNLFYLFSAFQKRLSDEGTEENDRIVLERTATLFLEGSGWNINGIAGFYCDYVDEEENRVYMVRNIRELADIILDCQVMTDLKINFNDPWYDTFKEKKRLAIDKWFPYDEYGIDDEMSEIRLIEPRIKVE